ncbi:hypothetical protein LC040_13735 [Bacillus tianshenii]|nr:hypothetical protein LC040_13735 [Bacillus tianshenii]
MEKYRPAWKFYLESCRKHGLEAAYDFSQFMKSLTVDQLEKMLEQARN